MFTIMTTDTPSPEQLQAVDAGLEAHNDAAAPLHDVRPLAAMAMDESGTIIGGAIGRTWGACCEIQQIWVKGDLRSHGIGRQVVLEFEQHARTRDCRVFYLTTFSFQAPEFYRKLGYDVIAEIRGYPNEIAKFLMLKVDGLDSDAK